MSQLLPAATRDISDKSTECFSFVRISVEPEHFGTNEPISIYTIYSVLELYKESDAT